VSYLRALVLLVVSAFVVVAVPAVTSATTTSDVGDAGSTAAESSAATTATTAVTTAVTTTPPTTTAPPTTTPPPTTTTPTQPRLTVEPERSVTYYRERGVPVSASGLDVDDAVDEPNAVLRFDGEALQELYVVDGAFEVSTTFPVTTPGNHLVSVTAGDRLLASVTVDVLSDLYTVTAKPSWITAEKLATDGVTLSAREVPPNGMVTAYLGDNPPVTKKAVDDGTISITIRNTDDSTLEEPGINYGVLETEDGELSSVAVRTTVLDVTAVGTTGEVRATGFEPSTDVALTSSRGSSTATASSSGVATFTLADFVGEVTATGTAGTVTALVDTRVAPPLGQGLSPAEMARIKEQAKAVDDAQKAQQELAKVLAQKGIQAGPLPEGAREAVLNQLIAYEKLFGGLPEQKPSKTTDSGTKDKQDALDGKKKEVVLDKKAAEKVFTDAAADAATQAEDSYSRATEEQQKALDEMLQKIIQFVKDLNDAKTEQMRALTRASTLELVSVGPLGDTVRVPVPVGFTGRHHVGTIEPTSGVLLAWQPFDVVGTSGGSGALPDTGAPVTPVLLALGAGLVVAGASAVATSRRRRTT
jgi:hypothetical protein